jgi:hypothetical protein
METVVIHRVSKEERIRRALNRIKPLLQQHIAGDLDLPRTPIESLDNVETVGGNLNLESTPITSLGNLETVGGNVILERTPIKSLGKLETVGGNLCLENTQIESLGNLHTVGDMVAKTGDLYLSGTPIASLGDLTTVGGNVDLLDTPIKSLGSLASIGGNLLLESTPIESLGNLVSVGGCLYLENTAIQSLGNIETVGNCIHISEDMKVDIPKHLQSKINVHAKRTAESPGLTTKMTIRNLLKGKNRQAQIQLDTLFDSVGDKPNILWYPSAGNDYRDILEFCDKRAETPGMTELPDLFIHTDYKPDWVRLRGTAFNDKRTNVRIDNRYELQLNQEIEYYIDPEYAYFAKDAPNKPTIYLLDLSVTSSKLGEIKNRAIYFLFENINFLDEVLLKNSIPISHLIKVREGCGWGGNKKSISIAYAFLSALETQYVLIDREEDTDFALVESIKAKHKLTLLEYDLSRLSSRSIWGNGVNMFSLSYGQKELGEERFAQILKTIAQR